MRPRIEPGRLQCQKESTIPEVLSNPKETVELEGTVQRGVNHQMSALPTAGKVGFSWLSLELVKGQASGQGVITRGKTTRITSNSHSSIGHYSSLISHETPTASCAQSHHLDIAECGRARASAGSYLKSRLRRPPPTLRDAARLIRPRLGSHPKPGMWDQRRVHVKGPITSPRPRSEFCLKTSHSVVVLSVGLLLMREADEPSNSIPIVPT
jgi:hypothetical protein